MDLANIEAHLTQPFAAAFVHLGLDEVLGNVVPSQRPEISDFQCNGAMQAAKPLKRSPLSIAEDIVAHVGQSDDFDAQVVPPGFINITLSNDFLARFANTLTNDPRKGVPTPTTPAKVVVDFGGPNVAKPMHVGHLRASIIGDCLQRLFKFVGDDVTSDVHLGDWGTQMGMLICAVARQNPDLPYFDENYTGPYPETSPVSVDELSTLYPEASALCKSDDAEMEKARQATAELQRGRAGYRALWQHFVDVSVAELKEDFASLGIYFDLWKGESDADPLIPAMLEKMEKAGLSRESDGARVIDIEPHASGKELPPLILQKSDGAVMYGTTDLATIKDRINTLNPDTILYVVDNRQSLHFQQVFSAAKQAHLAPNTSLEHIAFGTMNGKDGKPFKTRAGGVMRLRDLITMAHEKAIERQQESASSNIVDRDVSNKVALAAIKFADLSNHRLSDYIFDLDKFSSFEGKTGPYLLYTIARINSLRDKLNAQGVVPNAITPPQTKVERDLILAFNAFAHAIKEAYEKRAPNYLCEYVFTLAQAFSTFYNACNIQKETDPQRQGAWLQLCLMCQETLITGLHILGIDHVEKM